jgi:DNA-binding winged helix-turn-helix (wHTH) protein
MMNLKEKTAMRGGQPIKLSPIGWRLLEVLLRASPEVVSRRALENAVWNDEPPDSDSLKVHIFKLRKAVDGSSAIPLLHTIAGHGFAIRSEVDETTD